jgi:hypothetical protein
MNTRNAGGKKHHGNRAAQYDVIECHAGEALFGLAYEYVKPRAAVAGPGHRHRFRPLKRLTFFMYEDGARTKRSLFTAYILRPEEHSP